MHTLKHKLDTHRYILAVLIFAMVLISLFAYRGIHVRNIGTRVSILVENNVANVLVGALTEGTQVRQTFEMDGVIKEFSIQFATWMRENNGAMAVELFVDRHLVFQTTVQYIDIVDNAFHEFQLPNAVRITNTSLGEIVVTALAGAPGNSITIWMSYEDVLEEGQLYINGIPTQGDLSFQVVGSANGFIRFAYWFFAAFLVLSLSAVIYIMLSKKISLEKTYILIAAILGLTYLFLLPPLSAPDERVHIATSYGNANIVLGHHYSDMRSIDLDWAGFTGVPRANINDYRIISNSFFSSTDSDIMESGEARLVNRSLPFHFFSSVGIVIARLFGLGVVPMLFLGRLLNLVVFIALTYYAIKFVPIGKMVFFCVALFPMTLQQAASFSPDSGAIAIAFFAIAYSLYLIYKKEKVTILDFILVLIAMALLSTAKGGVYFPIVFLCCLVSKNKINLSIINFKFYPSVFYIGILLASLISLFIVNRASIVDIAGTAEMVYGGSIYGERGGYSPSFIMNNPAAFVVIFINSLARHGTYYLYTTIGHPLSHFSISVPLNYIFGFLIIAIFSTFKDGTSYAIKSRQNIVYLLIVISSFGLIFLALFFGWTRYGADFIDGVQGRYFIPFAPLLLVLISNVPVTVKRNINNGLIISICMLQVLTMLRVFTVITN